MHDTAVIMGLLLTVPGTFLLIVSLAGRRKGADVLYGPTGYPVWRIHLLYAVLLLGTSFTLLYYGYSESHFTSAGSLDALGLLTGLVGIGLVWLVWFRKSDGP